MAIIVFIEYGLNDSILRILFALSISHNTHFPDDETELQRVRELDHGINIY